MTAPQSITSTPPAPRRPWLAALLTFGMPGLGHLYAGAPTRAAAAWIVAHLAALVLVWPVVLAPSKFALLAAIIGGVVLWTGLVCDAIRTAKRAPTSYRRQWYNRWYLYLALPLATDLLITRPAREHLMAHIHAFRIPTNSMSPTIMNGDYIYATALQRPVRRGDLLTYRYNGSMYVKRVVALAGDTIAMTNDTLIVNHRSMSEPYIAPSSTPDLTYNSTFDWQRNILAPRPANAAPYRPSPSQWGPLIVPPHTYFFLGDNRSNSMDSRYTGPLNVDSVTLQARVIYFSRDPQSGIIRWPRIGTDLRQ